MKERNLNAYYYSFDTTKNDYVDAILEAVADAGHSSHHTDTWSDGPYGTTLVDVIQNAAESAANELKRQQQLIDELVEALNGLVKQDYNVVTARGFEMEALTTAIAALSKAKGETS